MGDYFNVYSSGSYELQQQALANPIWLVHLPVSECESKPCPHLQFLLFKTLINCFIGALNVNSENSFTGHHNYKEIGIRS